MTKGQAAYEARKKTGDSWDAIATRLDIASASAACGGARKFAKGNGYVWPVRNPKKARRVEAEIEAEARRVEEDAKLYAFIRDGGHYHQCEGQTVNQVYKALERHVERTGAPDLPRNPQRAYDMRAKTDLSWREIAVALGYRNVSNCIEAAKLFAEGSGKDWPLGSN